MPSQPENTPSAPPAPPAPIGPTAEMDKHYTPAAHEGRIRARWESSGAWKVDPATVLAGQKKPYCILIPPPNVTDRLHLGHALNNTLQDVLVRAHRMMGFETLWMPGTDHAGIATQAVVEKRLRKEGKLKGPLKTSMQRDEFVAVVQAFKDEYEATITGQLKAMGCSCDWERQRFTMDPQCVRAVREAFFRLFKDGLIYRGKRLVNWDPALQTAVADDECYDEEVDSSFWYLRYPLVRAQQGQDSPRDMSEPGGHGTLGGEDAVPVTWGELAARGYPGAGAHGADQQAWVTVATTRPETYLGDTAVAVNPHDPRAKALAGFFAELPLVGRIIPIIWDSYVVLPAALARTEEEKNDPKAAFATGFLKVTPAHDQNDYEIGQRHKLQMINVMAPDGSISDKHGWTDLGDAHIFVGKKREEARKLAVKEFEARSLLEATRPYRHSLKHSDRSKAIVEPYLSDQWYVKVTDPRLAAAANRALVPQQRTGAGSSDGEGDSPHANPAGPSASGGGSAKATGDASLTFHPARYARTYEQWHEGIRDWCISRQLWWGHRITVWTATGMLHEAAWATLDKLKAQGKIALQGKALGSRRGLADRASSDIHACPADATDAATIAALESIGMVQDPDVLDTWFSSALWPMSTMGWPDETALLKAFNPSSTLCTAREIITLWVSRMVMFNRYFRGEDLGMGGGNGPLPFKDVFIHAVIQDGEGRKMSKSLGNGIDPLDIIATHGSDAMRYTVVSMTTQTQDVRMPVQKDSKSGRNTSGKFDAGRNFCNKLWNAARYTVSILAAAEKSTSDSATFKKSDLALVDRWMLSRLAATAQTATEAIARFDYSEYAQAMYDLLWRDFCDWYLEAIKPTVAASPSQQAVLAHALQTIIRLLHPIAPFITEAIWERLAAVQTAAISGVTLAAPRTGNLLATAGWPVLDIQLRDAAAEAHFSRLQALAGVVNQARAAHNVPPKRKITLHATAALIASLGDGAGVVATMAGLEKMAAAAPAAGEPAVSITFETAELHLAGLADAAAPADAGAEVERLTKLIAEREKSIATVQARLNNPGYIQKAPPKLVEETNASLAKLQTELQAAREALAKLSA